MGNQQTGDTGPGFCHPQAGKVTGFIQPLLLLLLSEHSAHGYQLLEKLNQSEDTRRVDPGLLYRTLRQFEQDRLVESSWDVEGRGPARRVYEIAPDGVECLHAWAGHIRSTRERLGRFLETYDGRFKSHST